MKCDKTKGGSAVFEMTNAEYCQLVSDYTGLCLACGAERSDTEGDAEGYDCEECGNSTVSGAEMLMIEGRIELIHDGSVEEADDAS